MSKENASTNHALVADRLLHVRVRLAVGVHDGVLVRSQFAERLGPHVVEQPDQRVCQREPSQLGHRLSSRI